MFASAYFPRPPVVRYSAKGTIPPELSKLGSLVVLDLSWNKLHGTLSSYNKLVVNDQDYAALHFDGNDEMVIIPSFVHCSG